MYICVVGFVAEDRLAEIAARYPFINEPGALDGKLAGLPLQHEKDIAYLLELVTSLRGQLATARKALEHIAEHEFPSEIRPSLGEQPTAREYSWQLEGYTTLAWLAQHALAMLGEGSGDE